MCDEGRFGFKYIHDDRRLKFPKLKNAASGVAATGTASQTSDLSFADPWPTVLGEVKKRIRQAIQNDPSGFVAVLSPLMTVEEAYLLASYIKGIDPRTKLTLGPVPTVGSDDLYPKGPKGEPPAPGKVKFTIRAEKCPNRLGVEAVLRHFERAVVHADSLGKSSASAWYVVGGYSAGWVTESLDQAIGTPSLLIVQDIFPSPLSDRADIVLAAGSFAEREGTYVNHAGLAQAAHASIRPPEEARADGRILMELAGRSGLFNAMALRKEIGTNIAEFSAIAIGDLGEHGVRLAKYANQTVGARS
jgi:NADH-quinone oxidoreductase subunit G